MNPKHIEEVVQLADQAQRDYALQQTAIRELRETSAEAFTRMVELVKSALPCVCNPIPAQKPPSSLADDAVPQHWMHVFPVRGTLLEVCDHSDRTEDAFEAVCPYPPPEDAFVLRATRLYLLETGQLLDVRLRGWHSRHGRTAAWTAVCEQTTPVQAFTAHNKFIRCLKRLRDTFAAQDRAAAIPKLETKTCRLRSVTQLLDAVVNLL